MKKPMKDQIGDFMAGKGFYIVLFLCVAAIGISGYYLFSSITTDMDANAPVAGKAYVTITPTPAPTIFPEQPVISDSPRPTAQPVPTQAAATSGAGALATETTPTPETSAPVQAALVFTWPVKGEVLNGFSVETLSYDLTMGDWRTHSGIDVAADQGIQIRATAAGTISAIENDPLMGTSVVITHADGLASVYSNLADTLPVELGDEVFTGDIIGEVGNTAIAESGLPSHLHFAMMKNDLPTDPIAYLPDQT